MLSSRWHTNTAGATDSTDVLILSDGAGEDWVGVQLALALQQVGDYQVTALPLVGEGEIYRQHDVPVLGGQWLPSGGFTFKHWPAFWQDMQGGLLAHCARALQESLALAQRADIVLAVGDVLPLFLAWRTGRTYAFIGCTKSDYYSPGQSCYLPPERWLMRLPQCCHSYTRDRITADHLQKLGVRASFFGNPMMDGLTTSSQDPPGKDIGLLPGSRPGEAQANFVQLLRCTRYLQDLAHEPMLFTAAIAPGLGMDGFIQGAVAAGWQWQAPYVECAGTRVWLRVGAFGEVLRSSQLFLAMAGTATEQAVGLGRPVVTMPGAGPQFTLRFAQLQCQLLGESVLLCTDPQMAAQVAWETMHNPEQQARIQANGLVRMGLPGASDSIVHHLQHVRQDLHPVII